MSLRPAVLKIASTDIADVSVPITTFFIVATYIVDIISPHGYCDIVTFILKQTLRSHLDSILDVQYMHKKIMR
jgi:hypothetical protein